MSDVLPRPIAREATRRPFSMDEALEMQAAGHFRGLRTQLLDGEVHVMPHDGVRHIRYAMELAGAFFRSLSPERYFIGVQTTLHLSRFNGPSPDLYVLRAGPVVRDTPAERILLVVEVADSSLKDDLGDAASRYARHGVREYWVVDASGRQTFVHREPQGGAYPEPLSVPFEMLLSPALIPEFAVRIADFEPPEGTSA